MVSQAFGFLDEPFTSAFEPSAPVNVFAVAGVAQRETIGANVLAFLLDPNARHRFGTTFVDALLAVLDGAPATKGPPVAIETLRGSSAWSVEVEGSSDGRRSEILLEHEDFDVAILIESVAPVTRHLATGDAIEHAGRTSFPIARSNRSTVVTASIAATRHLLTETARAPHEGLTYDDLFDAAEAALYAVGPMADQRSLELYAQFRETTSERIATMTTEHEQVQLDELWAAIEHRQDQVLDFFTALDSVNAVLVARATRLHRAIGDRLDAAGIEHTSRVVNAGDHAWGRSRGERALVYVGFSPSTGGTIELLVGWLPRTGTFGYAVKAHQTHHHPPRPWDHIPLGLAFADDEDAVVDRFVHLAWRWLAGEQPD